MTPAQFQAAGQEILQNYWRINAANAVYGSLEIPATARLDYTNTPAVGLAQIPAATESVADAISALNSFIAQRLPRDLFLALIAEFESRVIFRLASLGLSTAGTLGQLQRRIEANLHPATVLVEDLDEVRERRNAMIHHADIAGADYVAASALVLPRAAPFVTATAIGDRITPTASYLTYAIDVLVRYSNALG